MEADFWHARWEKNQIGFHQSGINSHLQDFWPELKLSGTEQVFVPLCGKSSDMLWLRAQGHTVLGVELSQIAVRDFFAENQLEPEISRQGKFERWEQDGIVILLGDFFDLSADDLVGYGAVFDRASLVALPPAMRPAYAQHIQQIAPANCKILLVTVEYEQSITKGPPFSVTEPEVRDYYAAGYTVDLLRTIAASADFPGLIKKGVPTIDEKVFLLS
ncbi:MAG: thiopurine S-methyltransferase [Thiothrix nivea]|nr:MAG: thiopurine S-methyltransferase [Thiothrix nivea]